MADDIEVREKEVMLEPDKGTGWDVRSIVPLLASLVAVGSVLFFAGKRDGELGSLSARVSALEVNGSPISLRHAADSQAHLSETEASSIAALPDNMEEIKRRLASIEADVRAIRERGK